MNISAEEMVESLTYYDELAIEKAFGQDWATLSQEKPVVLLRALSFVQKRRDGMTDADAKKSAFEASLKEVQTEFITEDPEIDPNEPDTESGKDDSPSE